MRWLAGASSQGGSVLKLTMLAPTSSTDLRPLLLRLWAHLSRRRRRQFVLILGLMVVSAFAEVVSLGAVLPFLAILVAPDRVLKYHFTAQLAHAWGITSAQQLVLPLTVLFVLAALLSGAIRTLLMWCITRLSHGTGAELSAEVYRRTLYQPYYVHVARNSSEVLSGITVKVLEAVNVLYMSLVLVSSALSVGLVTAALFAVDPAAAAVATAVFGGAYALVMSLQRRRIHRNGVRVATEQTHVVKAIQEGLGGIRDVLLDGTQSVYCDIYVSADLPLRRAQGNNIFVTQSPRYLMDTVGMVLIAVLAYGLSLQPGGVATAVPVLGALALGAQRLLPTLQQCYSSWAGIVSSQASLSDVLRMLDQPLPPEALLPAPEPLPLRDSVRFVGVRFRYSSEGPWVLDGLDFAIARGSRIGIVGATGSGKSTTLDLLMGLLMPSEGEVLVDGEPVRGERVRAWQRTIAHVPQTIFLADTTLAENIAFGVPRGAIDFERVRLVARQAQIADFIESRPDGFDASIGERGVRLSGGQRQRIGIARALYKRASLLVFDEATSALDNATERSVMDAIEGLQRDLTIVLIAHRLTTVRRCDTILELDQGRVVAHGSYDELLQSSPTFRRMVRAAV
jgi:ATP-binding cassette, subfamily B, bacterial PglK